MNQLPEKSEHLLSLGLLRLKLKAAVRQGSFDVHYQPQINLKTGTCVDFEALVRWNDAQLGQVSPAIFIPVAEEMGLIDGITHFVIDRVAADIRRWRSLKLPLHSVAINISARHFIDEESAEKLLGWLMADGLPIDAIKLELTETAMLQHTDVAQRYIHTLRASGFGIALDDFGTGYSSVSHLLQFPITEIKIDRSFVAAIINSSKCMTIVLSLIELAQALGIEVVAEGVEQAAEMELLKDLGCTFGQGFFFAKPLPAMQAAAFMGRGPQPRFSRVDAIPPAGHFLALDSPAS